MNTDKHILDTIIPLVGNVNKQFVKEYDGHHFPLDSEVLERLQKLREKIGVGDDDFQIFRAKEDIMCLWGILLRKSIECLRLFDKREPFLNHKDKMPFASGVKQLKEYFYEYSNFENLMYGGVEYYRDHLIHVFRVWLLGIKVLLTDDKKCLNNILIEKFYDVNDYEKLSMWTIIALTHDLGYPLEKASQIVDSTKKMMGAFVHNPILSMDLSFSGVQDSMNDYIVRFISSKMWEIDIESRHTIEADKEYEELEKKNREENADRLDAYLTPKRYVARLQPKYYFKFQKSLEHNQHGILGTLIIYKLLLYFLESDYSLNEDYLFDYEDSRQFYIRREILRAIASHTCKDVYQLSMKRFSFLLIIADDLQDWGRKGIAELYVPNSIKYNVDDVRFNFGEDVEKNVCDISDTYIYSKEGNMNQVSGVINAIERQCRNYRAIFRDGQDTINRDFSFHKVTYLDLTAFNEKKYVIDLSVSQEKPIMIQFRTELKDQFTETEDNEGKKKYDNQVAQIFSDIFGKCTLVDNGNTIEYKLS